MAPSLRNDVYIQQAVYGMLALTQTFWTVDCPDFANAVTEAFRRKPLPECFVGPTNRSIDTSSVMSAFFREHRPLRK